MTYHAILEMAASGLLPSLFTAAILYFIYWKFKRKHSFVIGIFLLYICMLFYVTIYRYGISLDEIYQQRPQVNVVPLLSTWKLYQYGGLLVFLYNIIGNICWFIPFGFLLPYIHKTSWLHVCLWSCLLSFSIECSQFLLNCGISDIDDLIFNTIGGWAGYGCYCIFHEMKQYFNNRKKEES